MLIQGDATAEDRIVTDVSSDPDLAALMETLAKRQPAGAFWSSALGRRMWWSYYMRILIYVDAATCTVLADTGFHTATRRNSTSARCVVWAEAAKWLNKFDEAVLTVIDPDGYPASVRVRPVPTTPPRANCRSRSRRTCAPSRARPTCCATPTTRKSGNSKWSAIKGAMENSSGEWIFCQ